MLKLTDEEVQTLVEAAQVALAVAIKQETDTFNRAITSDVRLPSAACKHIIKESEANIKRYNALALRLDKISIKSA